MRRARRWSWTAMLIAAAVSGCVYYNAMWSAEHHAKDARHLEQRGQRSEARAQWAQAAVKAAAVVTRHPRSRWADDALVLQAEGLAHSGSCDDAAPLIARARARAGGRDATARERLDLADAECALSAGDLVRADAALALPLASRNGDRRSRAEYVAGQAAARRLDYEAATVHFSRSREADAAGRVLVAQQQILISRATQRSELTPIAAELTRVLRTVSGTEDASRPLALIATVTATAETPGARFRAAELARDSLHAPILAGQLFLDAAAADTASLYAPKALVAALAVLSDRRDSIVALLDTRYAASPYTRVFHGESSVAYAAAEDSLARELGVAVSRGAAAPLGARSELPVPGPRGPRDRP